MKMWKNITLKLPGLNLSQVSDKISELDIVAITIKDKLIESESTWFDDMDNPPVLSGDTHDLILLINDEININKLITQIREMLNLYDMPNYIEEIFEDKDWVVYTQSQFKEIHISNNLRIVPSWETGSPFHGTTVIIEPGTGFGIGSHPTTQLCLKWLEQNIKNDVSVLDYGTGSGILAITAKKLGGGKIQGVDIDPKAMTNALQNNRLNKTDVLFSHTDNFISNQKFDVVLANILSSVLIKLSFTLKEHTKKHLVLSGVLENQVDDVLKGYSPWIRLSVTKELDGWVLLEGLL